MSSIVKLIIPGGWCSEARAAVINACNHYKLPFLDRTGIPTRDPIHEEKIDIIRVKRNTKIPEAFIYWSEKDKKDFPGVITRYISS